MAKKISEAEAAKRLLGKYHPHAHTHTDYEAGFRDGWNMCAVLLHAGLSKDEILEMAYNGTLPQFLADHDYKSVRQ